MHANPFSDEELAKRLANLRTEMAARGLDIAVLSQAESVFYLIGLDHWGYFAPTHLIVPMTGDLVLVTRQMERVTIENQVRNARFAGHSDSESAAGKLAGELLALGVAGKRLGFEVETSGFTYRAGQELFEHLRADWVNISGLVDALSLVKSPEEQKLMRAAAKAADAGMQAAIAAIHDGAREADVAAECLAAMTRAGGTPAWFWPVHPPRSAHCRGTHKLGRRRLPKGRKGDAGSGRLCRTL